MIDFLAISAVVGAALPVVTSLVKNIGGRWPLLAKQLLAIVLSGTAAILTVAASEGWDELTFATLVTSWGTVYGSAQITYANFWGDRTVNAKLSAVGSGG